MSPKHYANMRDVSLPDYITPNIVRTISESARKIRGGPSEIPLVIQLKKGTAERLSFPVPWDGMLYGFIRGKEALRVRAGLELPIRSATLSDWDGRFALILETEKLGQTAAFSVKNEDVIFLLENCLRAPEQKSKQ